MLTGIVAGYDPGGNGAHGVAALHVHDGAASALETRTLETAEDVIRFLEELDPLVGLGIDTLTCWSTGPSGWRPADRWLRSKYGAMLNSVISPNGLFGSMGLNGMAVLLAAKLKSPNLVITETHPKVLYWRLSGERYDFPRRGAAMSQVLARMLAVPVAPATEHEWDAALSAFAVFEGLSGRWLCDLHSFPTASGERLVSPLGPTRYFWPE